MSATVGRERSPTSPAAPGMPGSHYSEPFTDHSPFGSGNTTRLAFNYSDEAGGAVWVRLIGWLRRRPDPADRAASPGARRGSRASRVGSPSALSSGCWLALRGPGQQPEHGVGRLVDHHRRLGRRARSACLLVLGLIRSPWGAVLQGHPRGRGRRAQPRQERLREQDAGAGARRRHRGARRDRLRAAGRRAARLDGPVTDLLRYTALLLGGAATIFGPVLGR